MRPVPAEVSARTLPPLPFNPSSVPEACYSLAGGTYSIDDMLIEILLCHNRKSTNRSRNTSKACIVVGHRPNLYPLQQLVSVVRRFPPFMRSSVVLDCSGIRAFAGKRFDHPALNRWLEARVCCEPKTARKRQQIHAVQSVIMRNSVRCAPHRNIQHQRYCFRASSSQHQQLNTNPTFLPRTSMCIANSEETNHAHILPQYSPVSFPHASFVGVSKALVCQRTSSTTSLSTGWSWSNVLKVRYGCALCSPRTGHRMYTWHLQQQNTQNTFSNNTFKFLDRTL